MKMYNPNLKIGVSRGMTNLLYSNVTSRYSTLDEATADLVHIETKTQKIKGLIACLTNTVVKV